MKTTIVTSLAIATAAASFVGFSSSAQAAMFGTGGISFAQNTTVNFQFLKSQGKAISTFGVASSTGQVLATLFQEKGEASAPYMNAANPLNQWLGGEGNLVGSMTAEYTFLAGQVYSLFVGGTLNGQTLTNKFSTSALNVASNGEQHAVFDSVGAMEGQNYGIAGSKTDGLPTLEYGTAIGMEDLRSNGDLWTRDSDYNDFVVVAQVPEPITMTGLALGIGGMVAARRRRNEKKA